MSDIVDQAEATEQLFRDVNIAAVTGKKIDTSNPSGECWYCAEKTGNERRFCDSSCCSEWSRENE